MADAVVQIFLERLLITLTEQTGYVNEFRDQFERLQSELQFMQSFLADADRLKRKRNSQTLRTFMAELRELIYEAEDILADCHLQSRDEDQLSNDTMDARNDQMSRWSCPVYDHTLVVGLEGDTRKIKDWVFEAEEGILAIGVVGMGGLGKTTIAQKVFNDREIENWFERRMWVSVSQTFTEEQIMRSMLRNLGDASAGDDRGELLRKINQYLLGKRYLIVMDDVWGEDLAWWRRIYEGLPKGKGSSIIITTRNGKVSQKMGVKKARMHFPKFLSEDDSWLLFRKIAFAATEGECQHPSLEGVGKEIVEKCKGLPLAIKAVGGMMLYKPPTYNEWRRTADNFRDELAENDDSVMASLQLSYDELPPYLKSCFLSFSVYPEDCVIRKEQLVYWWIGEGFVPQRNGRSSIEAGEDCFSGLTNRCLVEVVDKAYNKMISTCKIHDMVRDLVIRVAEEDAFSKPNGLNCRHLGVTSDVESKQLISNLKLRALMSTTKTAEVNNIASNLATKFSECRYLRVLDISRSIFELPLKGLLSQTGSLQHLSYLCLSNTHPLIHLPPSLKKLKNLQILDVSYCQNLKMLPSYVQSFIQLRALDVTHCGSLQYLPKGFGKLLNLEVLLGFRPARSSQPEGCRISELKNLTRLRKLGLQLTCGDEIEEDALVNLRELQFLSISCFDSHGSDLVAKIDELYPPDQLDELSLNFYPGKTSPVWLNPASLPMLRYLSVCSGNLSKMHDSFWGENNTVWKIEALLFESLSDLGIEWTRLQGVMPSLHIVNASWCPELDSFPIEDVGFRGGVWIKEEHSR
ncbi:hypothetical protein AB3S75_002195 [Citrus x aurantiifolia]